LIDNRKLVTSTVGSGYVNDPTVLNLNGFTVTVNWPGSYPGSREFSVSVYDVPNETV
jgi:hypothetical protein